MKKTELEQKISENTYRISKLEQRLNSSAEMASGMSLRISILEKQNEYLKSQLFRIDSLRDELYGHITNQVRQLVDYIDEYRDFNDRRYQAFSDEIYQHVANQNSMRDKSLEEYKIALNKEIWMRTFGFDTMIADLQLSQMESIVPGNRNRLLSLKDTHIGETCFVIGNGPSLTAADLDTLKQRRMFCFASKGIYKIFDQTEWRPDLWGVSDLDYIEMKKDDINELKGFPKLVCAQSYLKKGILIRDAIYYPFIQAERTPRFFNQNMERGIHFYGLITAKLINIAVYMGFQEIYILGCDHSLPLKIDKDGKKIIDTSKNFHFASDYYDSQSEQQNAYRNILNAEKEMQYATDSYKELQYFCSEIGVNIYNATRGGELEVFPRIEFEKIFKI